jgi:hypothetical protein
MFKFLSKFFNEDKSVQNALIGVNDVDEVEAKVTANIINGYIDQIKRLKADVDRLEVENKEYKGYKLKYQVAMLQNNEAEYLELLEIAEKNEKHKEDMANSLQDRYRQMLQPQGQGRYLSQQLHFGRIYGTH